MSNSFSSSSTYLGIQFWATQITSTIDTSFGDLKRFLKWFLPIEVSSSKDFAVPPSSVFNPHIVFEFFLPFT